MQADDNLQGEGKPLLSGMVVEEAYDQIVAILFSSSDPVTLPQLSAVFPDLSEIDLRGVLKEIMTRFNSQQGAIEIREIASGYRITTRPEHHEIVRAYLKTKPSAKLSLAALETLAVIAYKQPVTVPEIMEIRGVKSSSTIRTLLEKKLIRARGRKKVVGRPMMYGTTPEFLVHFGLNDLSELPTLKELEELLADA